MVPLRAYKVLDNRTNRPRQEADPVIQKESLLYIVGNIHDTEIVPFFLCALNILCWMYVGYAPPPSQLG
jgi:hypothetical protein